MTYSEFRYSLKESLLPSFPSTIILNYNTVGGVTTIDDIAILIEPGNLPQLQEATLISLNIPKINRGTININVEPSTTPVRDVERGVVGAYFCYSLLTPDQRPIIPASKIPLPDDPETYYDGVLIEPITATGAYNYNTYNPLIGNTIADRESRYIVHSDRGTTSTNPTNLSSIISNQAVYANIQDSLYSDTGWTHGRYEGTKLTPSNNGGTDPILQGSFFEAAFFGADVENADIAGIDSADITFQQYLSSGKASPPTYSLADPALIYSIDRTVVQKASEGKLRLRTTGDILYVSSSGYLTSSLG